MVNQRKFNYFYYILVAIVEALRNSAHASARDMGVMLCLLVVESKSIIKLTFGSSVHELTKYDPTVSERMCLLP